MVVDESAFSASASNPDISARPLSVTEVRWSCCCVVHAHPLVLVFGGEVLIKEEVCRCWCTFDGVCSSLVLHRFPILRDVGNSECHHVQCSSNFMFAPHGLRWAQFFSLTNCMLCKIQTQRGVRLHQDTCGLKCTKRLKRANFQHCAHQLCRVDSRRVLSFNVSGCDDYSHMFDAFGDVFRCGYLQHLDCQCGCPLQVWNVNVVVVWANVCCGKETTSDDTDNIKLNRTDKSLMTTSTIFFPRLMWSFLLLDVVCGVRCENF